MGYINEKGSKTENEKTVLILVAVLLVIGIVCGVGAAAWEKITASRI